MIHELVVRENTWYKSPTKQQQKKKHLQKAQNLEWGEKCSLAKRTQDVGKHQDQH